MSKERRNSIKKNQRLKVIVPVVLAVILVLSCLTAFLCVNVHKCDDCEKTFYGKGYYKEKEGEGVIGSVFGSLFGDTENIPIETVDGAIICKECAMNNTSVKAELRAVEEFKR